MIIIVDFIKELLVVPYTSSSEKMSEPSQPKYIVYMRYFWCCTDNDCTENRIISGLILPDFDMIDYITRHISEKCIDVSKFQGSDIWIVISANPDNNDGYCKLEHNIYLDESSANLDFFTNDAKYKSIKKFEIPLTKSAMKKK